MSTRYFSVRRYLLPGVLLVGLLVGLLVASVAFATDIAVTTTNDVIAADSDCSLREAIIAANTNTAANGCMGGSNTVADTITLVNGATYDLTIPNVVLDENVSETGDLDIVNNTAATDLVINVADGGTATINATVPDRVLQILAGATVEIDGVVISGGDLTGSGGGIANISGTGTVTLNAVVVRDNTATSNGGGIYNNGPLIIENGSVIGGLGAGNSAGQGGGIYQNGGTLTLEDSTISHNTSPDGGGVFINTTGTMDVLNSTISANSANYGGGVANFGTLHVQSNSVIGGPGAGNVAAVEAGGLYNEMPTSIMTVDSSTVSYNTGGIGGGISNYRGTLTVTAAKILSNDASGNGDAIWNNYPVMDAVSITGSCIVNNGETALFNNQPGFSQTATGNWWGAADGPGGSGPGHGDTISTGLDTTGFEAAAILGCPFRGVVITETGGSTDVEEGGVTDTYSLVLTAKPTGDVTVSFDTGSQVQSIGPLTFTSLDWATPQAVTVTAVDDAVAEGPHTGAISHSASGGGFTGVSIAGVTAHITDNDTAGVVITETDSSTDVVEGGATDSYDVVLTSEPTGPVTVSVSTDSQVEPIASLTFTSLDWAAPQTVTVTAVDDAVAEGPHTGTISHTASDGGYGAVSVADVTVHIADNDTAGVVITETGGSTDVVEGGATDSYDVVLTSEPTGPVTITVSTDSQVQPIASLTFTTLDWAAPQTVTVTAVDDAVVEGAHTGAIGHTASGGGYGAVSVAGVTAHIADNDTAGVVITETDSSTDVVEGGATDSYTVVLTSEPTGPVTITVSTDSQVEPIASLTFTTLDWAAPQAVTVTAVDDAVVEGVHTGAIGHTASGGGYDAVSIAGVTAHIADNDTAGVVITETGGSTDVVEGGATDSYDVVLTSEPTGPVTITVSTDSQVQPIASLTFTSLDWAAPQTVTVTAVDDAVVEGAHTGAIGHTASGGGYDAVSIAGVTVHITDNDTAPEPAIAITPSPHDYGSVTVGSSASQTFTVSNTGTANLTLSGIAVSDISGGTFTNAGTGTCTTSSVLAPAVDCTIDATFSPSATGAASGSLDVTSDAASGSGTVALSGTGVAATNLVVNGDMEIDTTPANKLPDGWKISNLEAKDVLDLRAANVHDGLMAMMIKGSGVTKKLFQTIVMTGNAGKNFTFSAWGKATSSVTPGKSTVYVQFLRGTTVKQTVKLNFPAGTYAYTERTKSFTATSRFTSIKVVILYSMTKGAAWFDDIELTSP